VIAQLADPHSIEAIGFEGSLDALLAGAPTQLELSTAIWPTPESPSPGAIETLDSLDARLESYESRVSDSLDKVTSHMVRAMGAAHREAASVGGAADG
jgi:hypothetical protein